MKINEVLLKTKPMDRIKRSNQNWSLEYIIIDNTYDGLYFTVHGPNGVSTRLYTPTVDDLIADDWMIF